MYGLVGLGGLVLYKARAGWCHMRAWHANGYVCGRVIAERKVQHNDFGRNGMVGTLPRSHGVT